MKTCYFSQLILLCLLFGTTPFVSANNPGEDIYIEYPGYFEDVVLDEDMSGTALSVMASTTHYAPYGKPFTPKGDMRALIIFAGFGLPYDAMPVSGWESSTINSGLTYPNWVKDSANVRRFYSDVTQFENPTSADGVRNVSRFYYEMSKKKLRFMIDILDITIIINANGAGSFYTLNERVLTEMKRIKPNFDWSRYDNRKNNPNYQYDNSLTAPDSIVDFVIIAYRFDPGWSNRPVSNMNSWPGASGGFASLGVSFNYGNGYKIENGYTQCSSANGVAFEDMFVHEMAHGIFRCPHYTNANGIIGKYLYGQQGWGMMRTQGFTPFTCANGWERWYLGWIENIEASGVSSDIKSATDLNSSGTYTLRDFLTKGDALRLKIPNPDGRDQYLWIENHMGSSIFDNRIWPSDGARQPFPPSPRGMMAYIESVTDDRSVTDLTPGSNFFKNGANGFKFLHSKGNYDYTFDPNPITSPPIIWPGNLYYNFYEHNMNPIAGQGRSEVIRGNFTGGDTLSIGNVDFGSSGFGNTGGSSIDQKAIHKRNGVITHDAVASDANFVPGSRLSMASNPALINRPEYDNISFKMGKFYLNGMSVEFLSDSKNVKIRYNDVDINQSTRYCGFIQLPRITPGYNNPDIRILSNKTLTIDKSGTPNRHTKTQWGDFINLTEFVCEDSTYFKQEANSTVIVKDSTLFVLKPGSKYEIENGGGLTIRSGSTLMLQAGSNLIVKGTGRVVIESGAYLHLNQGANVHLADLASEIRLKNGYNYGLGITNPFSEYTGGAYVTDYRQIKDSGSGTVVLNERYDRYIQNTTFTTTNSYVGQNVYIGYDVIPDSNPPKGNVILNSGSNVTVKATDIIYIKNGFEVKKGATFTTIPAE